MKQVGYFYIATGDISADDFLTNVFYFNDFDVRTALSSDNITINTTESGASGYYVNQLLNSNNILLSSNLNTALALPGNYVVVASDNPDNYKITSINGISIKVGDILVFEIDGSLIRYNDIPVEPEEPDEGETEDPGTTEPEDTSNVKKYLDLVGLTVYHEKVVGALNDKASKPFIGATEPTSSFVEIWFDTSEGQNEVEEAVEVASYSLRQTSTEEELTFNEEEDLDNLIFNDETVVEETTSSEEELTFNETEDLDNLTFNE